MSVNVYVVTRAPQTVGNMAMGITYVETNEEDEQYAPLKKVASLFELISDMKEQGYPEEAIHDMTGLAMKVRTPVFQPGEILYLDDGGREVLWPGRKPDKWDVTVQHVGHIDAPGVLREAVELSKRVHFELESAGHDPEVVDAIRSIKEQA